MKKEIKEKIEKDFPKTNVDYSTFP